jgi:hypothetical protein
MDILFIFLFSTLLEKPPKIDIILPDKPFFGGEIVLLGNDNRNYWYDRNTNNWRNFSELGTVYKTNLFAQLDCNQQCKVSTPLPAKGKLKIVIIGKLYKQISGLAFLACNTDAYQCGNIRFTITSTGEVELQKLVYDNPVFRNIRGIENLF